MAADNSRLAQVTANKGKLAKRLAPDAFPLDYSTAMRVIRDATAALSPAPVVSCEGANTMDNARYGCKSLKGMANLQGQVGCVPFTNKTRSSQASSTMSDMETHSNRGFRSCKAQHHTSQTCRLMDVVSLIPTAMTLALLVPDVDLECRRDVCKRMDVDWDIV